MEDELSFCCLELKYCERCGALWLRRAGGQESYCARCFVEMEAVARPKERKRSQRAAHRKRRDGRDLQGVAVDIAVTPKSLADSESEWSAEGSRL
jgi:hypothetical protein